MALQVKIIQFEDLEMETEPIGCGSFKSVFRAKLKGIQGEPDGTQVCWQFLRVNFPCIFAKGLQSILLLRWLHWFCENWGHYLQNLMCLQGLGDIQT